MRLEIVNKEKLTVGELIKKLQQYPVEMPVMINGYEGGLDFPKSIEVIKVHSWGYERSYTGDYEKLEEWNDWNENFGKAFDCLIISRVKYV